MEKFVPDDAMRMLRQQKDQLVAQMKELAALRAQLAAAVEAKEKAERERKEVGTAWHEACEIARKHCPVEWGESHIKQGIPRLAADRDRLRVELEKAEQKAASAVQDFIHGRDKLCLVCGAKEPCELKDGPMPPCTFELTPMELKADRDRLAGEVAAWDALAANCWDLRCVDEPTGGDDADVAWIVIEHHMAKPHEREVGRGKTPLDALRAALSRPAQGAQGEASAGEKGGEA